MRKLFLIQVFILVCIVGFGQIEMNSAGRIGIGTVPNGTAKINMEVQGGGPNSATQGINIYTTNVLSNAIGILSSCYGAASTNSPYPLGSTCGIMGVAGGSGNHKNRGVVGILEYMGPYNTYCGAGIVGIAPTTLNTNISYDWGYAGYFHGDIKVTGEIRGTLVSGSDIRYKKNIVELESQRALNNVLKLNPIEYNLEQQYAKDENGEKTPLLDEESQLFKKKHYGLIAQELKEIYPDLVYEQGNGYLAVNYVELIPILIQSIKELKVESEENKREIEELKYGKSSFRNAETGSNISSDNQTAILYQNTPNPFTQSTEIKYYLPQSVHIAYLCIYDLQGKLLKQINIAQRGEGVETISATEFPAGIYLYGLIADGKEVDMKRMILTK